MNLDNLCVLLINGLDVNGDSIPEETYLLLVPCYRDSNLLCGNRTGEKITELVTNFYIQHLSGSGYNNLIYDFYRRIPLDPEKEYHMTGKMMSARDIPSSFPTDMALHGYFAKNPDDSYLELFE